jgi:hypothetical protein
VRPTLRFVASLALGAAGAPVLAQPLEPLFADAAMATRIDAASSRTDGRYRLARTTYTLTRPSMMGIHMIDGGEDVQVVDCAARTIGYAQRRFMAAGVVMDERTIPRDGWVRTLQPVPAVASAPRALAERLCGSRDARP